MNKVGISANPGIRDLEGVLVSVISLLEKNGMTVYLENGAAKLVGSKGMNIGELAMEGLDMLITIGGDGTVLRALHHINVPILGINMGRVGFLNEVSPGDFENALSRVINGEYTVDVHTRLCMLLNGEPQPPVLNELVVHSSQALKIREFDLYLDGNLMDTIRADGVIASTPTGSTGYALSAGGPLLDLRLEGFLVLPLLPFRVAKRPCVVPMESRLEIDVKSAKSCIAVLDGQIEIEISEGDKIEVVKADEPARFFRLEANPYEIRRRTFERLISH